MSHFHVFYPTYTPDRDGKSFRVEMVRHGTVTANNAKEAIRIARNKFGGAPLVEQMAYTGESHV